ncbi:cobaltochelatase subunit CobN [Streptomyces uncialis]|uniref:cobaltochelatase subunit CobN n=1 Tax=Streptomyces uncialis TaxID=1048205 RepID=UPI002257FFE6|nr:cobaltochelatase subunit CobN [Streptomyces uncialis]MCX4661265.1 cobaltochelatase subunit CobN [Streptomyces uncialis]
MPNPAEDRPADENPVADNSAAENPGTGEPLTGRPVAGAPDTGRPIPGEPVPGEPVGDGTPVGRAPHILLLSTSDTDLLSARAANHADTPVPYRFANPSRLPLDDLPALLDGAGLVVVRLLGGVRAWQEGLDRVTGTGLPVVVLSGEQAPDAQLMAASTVPVGLAAEAHAYLAHGGPANLAQLARFLSDTVLLTGHGFDAPAPAPTWGPLERTPGRTAPAADGIVPTVAVLYYRAHHMSGNTSFVAALCDAVENAGGRPLPLYVASLRAPEPELIDELRAADVIVTTVLAAGGTRPAEASAGGDDESWDAGALTGLDVPVLQALCLTSSRADWAANDEGVSPLDAASQIAVPEFDGRLITVPFSFKEIDKDGLPAYVADPERAARVAGTAVRHARLRYIPAADKRLALVLSAYPTKHSRIGNAVGLDTPASAVALLRRLRAEGYDFGPLDELPGLVSGDGDELIRALIDAGGHDQDWLTEQQLAANPVRIPAADYRRWFATLPGELREAVERHWGPPPGEMFVDRTHNPDGDIVLAALRRENLLILIQPPRGFGENPIAIYHDPDLPPSHHYLAAYRWISASRADGGFGADAMVHLGKHGNLEWLPGKNAGLSAACAPDAALGDLPLVYPFLVNDPGEGTQAKRRVHATLIDHLVPPMARADSYGDIARLEQLLDEYAQISSMDPAKLPAIRAQIWTLIQAARLDHDLGLENRPDDDGFDDFLLHVDGWLCEVKDAQIRDGLHVLGAPPAGDDRVNLVLAILRARQIWGGTTALPGLREALGLDESAATRTTADEAEATARALVTAMEAADWDPAAVAGVAAGHGDDVARVLDFAAAEVVPRLAGTVDELDHAVHALNGGFVPAGPSGSPLRGLVNVLPTGRNFYSVDPKAVPSRLAWETGQALADSLLTRYREDNGDWPTSVGLSLWGTSAMRTAGDDVAEAMALLGVRPVWDDASRRVTGLEAVPADELGRPRIDVTLRISGFFRDAFPHVIGLLDDAVRLVAGLDEPAGVNHVRAHAQADLAVHGDERRATTRIFGSRPGTYGAGLLQLIDSRDWRTDADLAEVYTVWGGYAYGRELDGRPAREEMETAYKRIAVAAKNTDTREHDIADSDDYFQYHGGMVATVRALRGTAPEAYIGDSTRPETVRTRTLVEETSRVFRARVVNPKWIEAMRRHGYKGAFELAATVDYLFGYDATTGVIADWMYDKLTQTYVLDPVNRAFLQEANPWALHGITERLLEAESRGLWAKPDAATLEALREVFLETEGDLEGGTDGAGGGTAPTGV